MSVSFAYSPQGDRCWGAQQVRRMDEIQVFAKFRGSDPSGGKIKAACRGVCAVPRPSLADPKILFFVSTSTRLLPSVVDWLAFNTVIIAGEAYLLTTEVDAKRGGGETYIPKSIERTLVDLKKLTASLVPRQASFPQMAPQPASVAGNADHYNNVGEDSPYNNVDEESPYNTDPIPSSGPVVGQGLVKPFVTAQANQSLYQNGAASVRRFGLGTHRFGR